MDLTSYAVSGSNNSARQISVSRWNALIAALGRPVAHVLTPEDYGATGDGSGDDTAAFELLAAAVNEAGGGLVQFARGKTYRIGQYITASNGNVFTDMRISGCNGLVIDLNGSKIDIKGDFDRDASTTYGYTGFYLLNCSNVVIRNGEIDGNVDVMTNSSASTEPPHHGVRLDGCTDVVLENLHVHHFAADGLIVQDGGSDGSSRTASKRIKATNCRFLYNARQGMSAVQVRGAVFENCEFSYTGRSDGTYGGHSPAAGVDIEPQNSTSSASPNTMDVDTGDILFLGCKFEENKGAQHVHGGSLAYDGIRLIGCRISVGGGSTSGADCVVVGCPGFVMRDCDIDIGTTDRIFYLWPNAANVAGDMVFSDNRFRGDGALLRSNGASTGKVVIEGNIFDATGADAFAGDGVIYLASGSDIHFRRNRVFVAKEMYTDGGSGDRHIVNTFATGVVVECEGNLFTTDLLAASGSGGTAHYANAYGAATVVRNDKFTGQAVGTADTFRPIFNGTFDTTNPFNRNHAQSNALGSSTRGDQATTFQATVTPSTLRYTAALTADRAVTLDTTAGLVFRGARCRVVRTASSTGAFNLNVGTGPLKALATGQWCEVEHDGSAWVLISAGSL